MRYKKQVMKKYKKRKSQISFRLNILFVLIFILFSFLILQLGVIQILNGEEAQKEIDETIDTNTELSVPRGTMYDRFGRVILENQAVRSITYTPPKYGDSAKKRLEIAEKLANFIEMEENSEELKRIINERDKKEYWYLFHSEEAAKRLSDKEKEDLDNAEQYQTMLDRIKPDDYNEFDWSDKKLLNIVAIKKELDQAHELSPHIIKNENVTVEEYAKVASHMSELPGIDAAMDWKRKAVNDGTFQNFIGRIDSIPDENRDYYLTHGYNLNDRVGISGLEEEYEEELRGRKEKVKYTVDQSGSVIGMETIVEGKRGNDLVLTIDLELQKQVDQIVQEELKSAIEAYPVKNKYLEDALVIMLKPKTGEILAMSGVHYDHESNEYSDESFRVIYDQYQPGSAIKGATVLAGLDSGVINIGTTIHDTPVKIASTPEKSSHTNDIGIINDRQALEKSSNVYMFHIALDIAGATYQYGEPLANFNYEGFQTMRNYFNQFGLGIETGIDLPYESTGVVGRNPQPGNLLDFAIGQYDTYTTLQLAQYVSTIANDGYRIRPRLVKESRKPEQKHLGAVIKSFNANVMNKISMNDKFIERVQQGFIDVYSKGTASYQWGAKASEYKMAGKTGTAQNNIYKDGQLEAETENLILVGYSPYNNPEIAFAVVVPKNGLKTGAPHHNIGKRIMDEYYNSKKDDEKME
ncbi:penicillin-binding protein 2 [Gracilibacillus sp. YIM 98692]|uniref:peptidoglycan D,D-transpeptidase FtsI family protein n=1 Tax=Gracilibacillus sp. YIM 98692 TaxID=2663532 RepID=UPI001F09B372|nr:penicillin-binding protein 2 [Gracilibacillus sp. YIM 98692]